MKRIRIIIVFVFLLLQPHGIAKAGYPACGQRWLYHGNPRGPVGRLRRKAFSQVRSRCRIPGAQLRAARHANAALRRGESTVFHRSHCGSTNLQKGDLAIIAGGLNFFPTKLIARPEIKRPADFKGKILAVGGFGAANHMALLVALEKLGVNPKDVTIIQVAGAAAQIGALSKGAIQGLMFNEPQATIAIKKFGMHPLIDLMESKTPFPQNCFIVKRSYLEAHRERVANFMRAVVEAIYLLKKDRPLALRLIKKYIRVSDEEAAIGYDYYLAKHAEGILELPDRRGLQFVIDETAKTNPKAAGQTPESLRLTDSSVLDELKKSGFVERIKK
jgi:NMT1/THI5 like